MSNFDDALLDLNAAVFAEFGEPITYTPNGGLGDAIETSCVRRNPEIEQTASPNYFADVELDPAVITAPKKNDRVTRADGSIAVVGKIHRPRPEVLIVALHLVLTAGGNPA